MSYEDYYDRAFGIVANCYEDAYFVDVYLGDFDDEYPCEVPDDLAYIMTEELGEVACLREYNQFSPQDGYACFRIVDERVRGWRDDEIEELVFPEGGEEPLALVAED